MAPLLSGFVRVLQFDGEIKHFLPQALYAAFLFLMVPLLWWTMWLFRDIDWHFANYFYMVIEPAVLFVACSLIFPQRIDHDSSDLERHYYKIRVPLLISLLVFGVLVFADGVILGIEAVWHDLRYVQVFFVATSVWALVDKRRSAQFGASLASILGSIILLLMGFWASVGPSFS
jgi:hypothetical protein